MTDQTNAISRVRAALDVAEPFEAPADGIQYGGEILRFSDIRTLLALAETADAGVGIPGYKLVPVEPTEEMLRAPWVKLADETSLRYAIWSAMLATSPEPTAPQGDREGE